MKDQVVKGTPIVVMYTDDPAKSAGKLVMCIPGSKFVMSRNVSGQDFHIRSVMAGREVASIIGNFIENNPVIAKEEAKLQITDEGVALYPVSLIEKPLVAKRGRKPRLVEDVPQASESVPGNDADGFPQGA